MTTFFIFNVLVYLILVAALTIGLTYLPKHIKKRSTEEKIKFSIVVAFRNEEKKIYALLKSFGKLRYPKELFEIILVNDASTDDSLKEIDRFVRYYPDISITILANNRLTHSPKKDAIYTAIAQSNHDWIVTTDADCVVPRKWLQLFNSFILTQDRVAFIAAPVVYREEKGFLAQFQQLDWLSLTAVTMGSFGYKSPMLCSGANLCYRKSTFKTVGGFEGNENIASGDDVFLLSKMKKKFPKRVFFLNSVDAIVQTRAVPTWKALLHQRVRWASKTGSIPNLEVKITGAVVFFMNLSLVLLALFSVFSPIWRPYLVGFFIAKFIVDSILIYYTSNILKQKINLSIWFVSSLVYPFFSVIIVFTSLFAKYEWKGRNFVK